MGAIQKALEAFGQSTVSMIQSNIAAAGENASGQTSRDIRWSMPSENQVVVSGPPYVWVLETGRRPGGMPPVTPNMTSWILAKGLSIDKSLQSVGFAISKSIAEKGTKLFQEGGRKDVLTPALDTIRIDQLMTEIADISLDLFVGNIDKNIN
jgi:hypothetical protein